MMMEHVILVVMWLSGITGFILFIPHNDRRKGILAFLTFQAIIWLCDMPAFKYGLLSAPVRELPKATDLALTIDYIFYPVLFSIYYVHRRTKGTLWPKLTSFFVWISAITIFDVILERYTDLLEYGLLTWYGMWMYVGFLFCVSLVCCNWFFRDKALYQTERWELDEN